MAPRVALLAGIGLLALAGCRTTQVVPPIVGPGADAPWHKQEEALEKFDRYSLTGRVAVAANGQGFSGSLRYQQRPSRSDLAIDGPLGLGGLRAVVEGDEISITTSRGENYDGNSAREELERRLGFALPLEQLRWWLLGVPQPRVGTVTTIKADHPPPGYVVAFDQDGWHVSIPSRSPVMGFMLPQRVTIEREGARLKLVVDSWK